MKETLYSGLTTPKTEELKNSSEQVSFSSYNNSPGLMEETRHLNAVSLKFSYWWAPIEEEPHMTEITAVGSKSSISKLKKLCGF